MSKILTFEDCLPIIDREISKRRRNWTLDAVAWMDWDDIAQNLRIHIAKKFNLWNQSRPLQSWLAAVIHNQLINTTRNLYYNFSPVCNKCSAYDGGGCCSIYNEERENCPLFRNWKKNKENAYNIKLPLSAVFHEQEIQEIPQKEINLEQLIQQVHEQMENILRRDEYRIYCILFIDHKSEEEASEIIYAKNKVRGLVKIKQVKKKIIEKAKKAIYEGGVDF